MHSVNQSGWASKSALEAEAAVEAAGARGRVVGAGVVHERQRGIRRVAAGQDLHQLVDRSQLHRVGSLCQGQGQG